MGTLLRIILGWFGGTLLQRMLSGAGVVILTATFVAPMVNQLLAGIVAQISGAPSTVLALLLRAGLGQAITIIGGAALARVAITTASSFVGIGMKH